MKKVLIKTTKKDAKTQLAKFQPMTKSQMGKVKGGSGDFIVIDEFDF